MFRVDRASPLAEEIARRYGVHVLPTLLIFDGQGKLVAFQEGRVDRRAAAAVVRELSQEGGTGSCTATPSPAPGCEAP